jgi:hypothetical protein
MSILASLFIATRDQVNCRSVGGKIVEILTWYSCNYHHNAATGIMLGIVSHIVPSRASIAVHARHVALLLAMLGFGLALGACSKCDMPTWQPPGQSPRSCLDIPPPQ